MPLHAHSFDLIVALEIIEHLKDPEKLVSEAARVVRPGGVVLISTPNKANYSDARCYSNPFHVKEFYYDELRALLGQYFRQVEIMHQRMRAGSMIATEARLSGSVSEVFTHALPECVGNPLTGMYFLAICSDKSLGPGYPSVSVYIDLADMYFQQSDLKVNELVEGTAKLRRKERAMAAAKDALESQIETLRGEMLRREQELLRQSHEFQEELRRRDKAIQDLHRQLAGQTGRQSSLPDDVR
jgi:SAM-dependent methyltransferase